MANNFTPKTVDGLCECGCGKFAGLRTPSSRVKSKGIFYRRFIHGHNLKAHGFHPTRESLQKVWAKTRGRKPTADEVIRRTKSIRKRIAKFGMHPNSLQALSKNRLGFDDPRRVRGEKHWNWKGEHWKFVRRIRETDEYAVWRKAVYKRDNYTCHSCFGKHVLIHAHHIKFLVDFPELAYDVSNGVTLCSKCHGSLHRKAQLERNRAQLEVYYGRN